MFLSNLINNEDLVLVCASKYFTVEEINKLFSLGITNFGENRVSDFLEKYSKLKENEDICWHFIGTLQTNKVKPMINKIICLHSLDNLKLARYVDRYRYSPLDCFIEVNITNSLTKHGLKSDEVIGFLEQIKDLKNVNVIGLMMMNDEYIDSKDTIQNFTKLKDLLNELNLLGYKNITKLSMGMSKDYKEAISCGSTHIRLGRILKEVL